MPAAENCVEDAATSVIVTPSLPVFVTVADCVAFWPTVTLEKVMFDGVIWIASCGAGLAFEVLGIPAQPLIIATPHATIANSAATAQPPRVPRNFFSVFSFAAFGLAIFPSGSFVPWERVRVPSV